MLAGRKISGKYKFRDGTLKDYCGSYELTALEFMDKVLEIKSSDILYQYNNEPIICIDMPRNNDESFMISGAIETLKNGRGLVGKYERVRNLSVSPTM